MKIREEKLCKIIHTMFMVLISLNLHLLQSLNSYAAYYHLLNLILSNQMLSYLIVS